MISNAEILAIFIFIVVIAAAAAAAWAARGAGAAMRGGGGSGPVGRYAYVSLLYGGDGYLPGVLVWARSLARTGTPYDILCMATPDVSAAARGAMAAAGIRVIAAAQKDRQGRAAFMGAISRMVEYKKVLYMDADTTVLANIDHIFTMAAPAAPRPQGRTDVGIMLLAPGAPREAAPAALPGDLVFYWFHDDMFVGGKKKIIHHIGQPKPWQIDAARYPDTRPWGQNI